MPANATISLRSRLRSDLRDAMKARRPREVQVIRELLAAIDNAEAPGIQAGPVSLERHQFLRGSAEVERLVLGPAQVRALMEGEVERRERAANEFERLGELERAAALRSEVLLAKRYACVHFPEPPSVDAGTLKGGQPCRRKRFGKR